MPPYQRPFSWGKANISRIFEDSVHGISKLPERQESVTFLGTVIAIHDTNYKTIKPIFQGEVPSRVMTIIDGQQRLSSILMVNIAFHNLILNYSQKIKSPEEPHSKWILELVERFRPDLEDSFMIDMRTGDDCHRYYPRMVRAYIDAWSSKESQARYKSPLTRLIWEYINFEKTKVEGEFKYEPKDPSGNLLEEHKTVVEAFKHIKLELKRICEERHKEIQFLNLSELLRDEKVSEAIFGYGAPIEVEDFILNQKDSEGYESFCILFRLLVLAKYTNQRMAFTVVTADNEDDAFDMFEALNTTGEPLTAYETFKPKVLEAETLEKFENSLSNNHLRKVDKYLDSYTKSEQKQRATAELLIPFALIETGYKLSKRLNDQRRYIRDRYAELEGIDDKRAMTNRLAMLSEFVRFAWSPKDDANVNFSPLEISDDIANLSILFLRKMKHNITIAPLCRFYDEAVSTCGKDDGQEKLDWFKGALKATMAFSCLWRGAFGGTENIDQKYRDIMSSGSESLGIGPFCYQSGSGELSLVSYKRMLRSLLDKERIQDREDWVSKAAQLDVYNHASREVARLLLMAASHNSVAEEGTGLVKVGRDGVNHVLLPSVWKNDNYFTVEHIAPQSKNNSWQDDLYESDTTVHRLGNLILVPQEVNSVLGAKSWEHKQKMYCLLSSKDSVSFETAKNSCSKVGLSLSASADVVLGNTQYLPMCESLANFNGEWNLNHVNNRSIRIAELAYDQLYRFLES